MPTPSKRDAIIHAAIQLILEEGVLGLSQAKIAAAAGLRQGHLTYYFPTRVTLLRAVVEHLMTEEGSQLTNPNASRQEILSSLVRMASSSSQVKFTQALITMACEDKDICAMVEGFTRQVDEQLDKMLVAVFGLKRGLGATFHTLLLGIATRSMVMESTAAENFARAAVTRFIEHNKPSAR